MKIKEIEGQSINGDTRHYKFVLMDAKTGLEIWHKYGEKLAFTVPADLGDDTGGRVMFAWTMLKGIPIEELLSLVKKMLASAIISYDDKTYKANDEGLGDWCQGAPEELYTALIYAALANYEKVLTAIVPFLQKLEETAEPDPDSTSTSIQPSEEKSPK